MKFSYSWLSDFVEKIPSPSKLSELLTRHAYQVESVQSVGRDTVFDIDILPNRFPDSSGHLGLAREIRALLSKKIIPEIPRAHTLLATQPKSLRISLGSSDTQRYMVGMVRDAKVKKSPKKIEERLLACGLRPINSIVDVTNYIMLETGNPVHAFDYDKLEGKTIFVRLAKEGEEIETIDETRVHLKKNHLVIADAKGPIAIAGIKGGKRAAIDEKTRRVVFEAAVFDPTRIREASKEIGLTTDASSRFSQGLPAAELEHTMWRLLDFVEETLSGIIESAPIDIYQKKQLSAGVLVRGEYVARLLGREISEKDIREILERLGFLVIQKQKGIFSVMAPSWRLDITCKEDVIEEIGRVFGYDRVLARPPHAALVHPEKNEAHDFYDTVRSRFKALGFFEVVNYAFESKVETQIDRGAEAHLELVNPISEDSRYLRGSLIHGFLKNIRSNSAREKNLRFFEVGEIFRRGKKPEEYTIIAAFLSEPKKTSRLYFEAKGVVETLFAQCGLTEVWFEDVDGAETPWPLSQKTVMHPYRSAFVKIEEETVGVLYELHPVLGLKTQAVGIELLAPKILERVEDTYEFRPLPKYPAIVRDLAVVVSKDDRVDDVMEFLEAAAGMLLGDIDLFDYYEEDSLGTDSKSLAFHLVFQAEDRTLTDMEVLTAMKKVEKAIAERGWDIRS